MGTRSTVKFYNEDDDNTPILSVYHQYDGYIEGIGHDLANFLKDKTIVNGYGSNQSMKTGFANGMGCLAAQYVAVNKKDIGGLYIVGPDNKQEYNYEVRVDGDRFIIKVDDIFEGTPADLLVFEQKEEA